MSVLESPYLHLFTVGHIEPAAPVGSPLHARALPGDIPRVATRTGWLPQLSPRTPEQPESLRARLFRQSRKIHALPALADTTESTADAEYRRLMGAINAFASAFSPTVLR